MILIKQNESTATLRRIPIYLVDITDGFTPEPGLSGFTIEVSKNGSAQGSGTGSVTEIGDGQYYYECASGEVDTLGFLAIRIYHASAREFMIVAQVIDYSNFKATGFSTHSAPDLSNLDVAVSTRSSHSAPDLSNLDTTISSRAPSNEYDSELTAIQSDLDNPNQYVADVSGLATESNATANKNSIITEIDPIPTNTELNSQHGSGSWTTGGGESAPTEQEIWEYANRSLTTPADYKATGFSVPNEYDSALATIQTDLDDPGKFKADISLLALETTVQAIKTLTDNLPVDTEAEIIKIQGLSGIWLVGEYHHDVSNDNDYIQYWLYGNQTDFDNETKSNAIWKWRQDTTYTNHLPTKMKINKVT